MKSLIAIHDYDDAGYNTIGQRIRQCRIKKGMSIKELADKLGRDYSFVSKYECDKRTPKDDLLIEISNVLGVSHLYLKYGQYFDEIDELGGIALHYYSCVKHVKNERKNNEVRLQRLKNRIDLISHTIENGEIDYIKILDDISGFLLSHTNAREKANNKLLKQVDIIDKNPK